jgi:hypothetical protein
VQTAPKLTRDPQLREWAIAAMRQMGVGKDEAAEHVDAVGGNNVNDVVGNAFRRRQALREGRTPPPMAQTSSPAVAPPPPAPISQAQAPQLGMPPGGRQAAPSTAQLQQLQGARTPQELQQLRQSVQAMAPTQLQPPRVQPQAPVGRSPLELAQLMQSMQGLGGPQPAAMPTAPVAPAVQPPVATAAPPAAPPSLPVAPVSAEPAQRVARVRMRLKQPAPTSPALGTVRGAEEQPPPSEQAPTQKGPQSIRSYDEYEKLQSGDHFVWSDGELYRKP